MRMNRDFMYKRAQEVIEKVGLLPEEISHVDTAPITTQVYIKASAVGDIKQRLGNIPVYYDACAFNVVENEGKLDD